MGNIISLKNCDLSIYVVLMIKSPKLKIGPLYPYSFSQYIKKAYLQHKAVFENVSQPKVVHAIFK